eukprot:52945_1
MFFEITFEKLESLYCNMGNKCTSTPTDPFWEVHVRSWTSDHVYSWLSTVSKGELKQAAITFKKHQINGSDLISISNNNHRLQSMNITIGDRLHLKKLIKTITNNITNNNQIKNNKPMDNPMDNPIDDTPNININIINNNNNNNNNEIKLTKTPNISRINVTTAPCNYDNSSNIDIISPELIESSRPSIITSDIHTPNINLDLESQLRPPQPQLQLCKSLSNPLTKLKVTLQDIISNSKSNNTSINKSNDGKFMMLDVESTNTNSVNSYFNNNNNEYIGVCDDYNNVNSPTYSSSYQNVINNTTNKEYKWLKCQSYDLELEEDANGDDESTSDSDSDDYINLPPPLAGMGGPLGGIGRPPLLLTNILSNTSMIKRKINETNDDNGDGDSDNDSENGSDSDYYEFHTQEIYEDHKIEELTSDHTKTLYMLETVKIYL